MAYEVFKRTNIRVDEPTLTIVPGGRINLNAATTRILVAAGVKSVLLLWDKDNRRLAIKGVHKGDKNAFLVSIVRNSSAKIRVKSFFDHIGWSALQPETVATTWNPQEKMFEVTLPQKCLSQKKAQVE